MGRRGYGWGKAWVGVGMSGNRHGWGRQWVGVGIGGSGCGVIETGAHTPPASSSF